jgi:glucokinase
MRDADIGRPSALSAAQIVEQASGTDNPVAKKVIGLFAAWLGRFAGEGALMFGALGGANIAGGIPPRILGALAAGQFRASFEAKGRMAGYLKRIPIYVILADDAGLRGAAAMLRKGRE